MRFGSTSTERGSAAIEFVGLATLLLVPLVYLILTIGQLQAGMLAAEGAARQAARVWALHGDSTDRDRAASRAVELAVHDFGLPWQNAQWSSSCVGPCGSPGSTVTITVDIAVPLPLVPAILDLPNRAVVHLRAPATQRVSLVGRAP